MAHMTPFLSKLLRKARHLKHIVDVQTCEEVSTVRVIIRTKVTASFKAALGKVCDSDRLCLQPNHVKAAIGQVEQCAGVHAVDTDITQVQ